jgi:alpha-beta hydrolase superfamily lysophospholipase
MPSGPSWRLATGWVLLAVILLAVSTAASTAIHLRLPASTGTFSTGKITSLWTDPARPEPGTSSSSDRRSVRVVAWYPAEPGTGALAAYLADLETIADGLVASGEVGSLETAGLRFVHDPARAGADISGNQAEYPVVLLSPGNATNVEFYSALAEEVASHGFVVIGLDHPFQVAAVALDGLVAVYPGDPPLGQAAEVTPARIDERVADITFVLDMLADEAPGLEPLAGHMDLSRIGIMGHSNGGVAAAEACADPRIDACLNIDGQLAGGPFSARPDPVPPSKPFMYLTKESMLHPSLAALFEAAGTDTFRVVVPAAAHDEFADPAMFRPRLLPTATAAEDAITVSRGITVAFFDHALRDAPTTVFSGLAAPTDIQIFVYPLVPRP